MKVSVIFGLGIAGKSYSVTRQRRLNCYLENRDDGDKEPIVLYGTPGMKPLFTIGSGPARAMLGTPTSLAAVSGATFYLINPAFATTYSTSILSNSGLVTLAQSPSQVLLVDGVAGYLLNGGTLTKIAAAAFPTTARTATFVGSYFVCEVPNTQQFQVSGSYDGTTWNALAFASASQFSDTLLAVDSLNGNLVCLGTLHTEFWQNVGSTPQPFAPILSATAEYGLAAIFSRAHVDNSLCFLAANPQGGYQVVQIKGYAVEVISTPDLEQIIGTFGAVGDAVALAYRADKHPMYQLTFPTANRSFLFDCLTRAWSETQTGITVNKYAQRHTGNLSALFNGNLLISDYATNQIYTPDPATFTDGGQTIPRELVTRHAKRDFNEFSIAEAYLDVETGVGLASGQGSAPQISLEVSKDSGRTWGMPRNVSIGAQGIYKIRAIWRRLGSARVFTFRVRMTDPVKFVLTAGAESASEVEQ